MSTICKLDPQVRERRTMRRLAVKDLTDLSAELLRTLGFNNKRTLQVMSAAKFLENVARSPRHSGLLKDSIFRQVAHQLVNDGPPHG